MCGIAGLVATDLAPEQRAALVEGMLRRIRHRGPDGFAVWHGDGVTLGITRLAIVAPGAPANAYSSEDGRIHSVTNGEIYNHRGLATTLTERGHRIEPGPDTALVPHLFEEHGNRFPERLDGMFGAAVWDARAGRLTLARDRAGEKPLFWTTATDGASRFAFASEPGALACLPWVIRDPDPAALARYLAHGYFSDADSAFAAIRQLPPAHVLTLRDGQVAIERYWCPWDGIGEVTPPRTDAELATATRDALESAVTSRIPDDVPFGVFLSGGVDSGLVATLAARHTRGFPVFSMKIPATGYDESGYARTVAKRIGAEYHEAVLDHLAGEEAIERFAAVMDQPLGDPSVLPTWSLAKLASQHVPVVLTGEGGDELFAGYPTYLGHRWAALANRLPDRIARATLDVARRVRPGHHHVTIPVLIERFLGSRGMSPLDRHLAWFGTATPLEARVLLAPALRATLAPGAERRVLVDFERRMRDSGLAAWRGEPGLLAWQILDFETYLGGGLLTKVDRSTMAHSVESRAPFLRAALIRYALALPDEARLRGRTGKRALKLAARGLLPDTVLNRRKQGFSPPFSAWVRGPLRQIVDARMSPEKLARAGVLDPAYARRVFDDHVSGRAERGRTLWTLLSLQLWAEHWLVHTPPPIGVIPAREAKRWDKLDVAAATR
jgi:asparagine synthase (glutamine-hydrolysing)